MITEAAFIKIKRDLQFEPIWNLWSITDYSQEYGFPKIYELNYHKRIELFCWIIQKLLEDGEMKIAKSGVFLEGSAQEQAEKFRTSFPTTEEDMKAKDSYIWFLEEWPGGAVWYTDIDDHGFQTTPVGDGRFYFWT